MSQSVKLVYIAGPSRSGSTLIAEQLATHARVFDLGEFRRISAFANEVEGRVHDISVNGNCACGSPVADCTFWTGIEQKSGVDFKTAVFDARVGTVARALFRTSALIFGPRTTKTLCRIIPSFAAQLDAAEACWKVFDAILSVTDAQALIDGSKQTHHFLMLYVARPESTALIGLFRGLRAVVSSAVKRPQKLQNLGPAGREVRKTGAASERALIRTASTSWRKVVLQQLLAFARMPSSGRAFVRYEDFCVAPDAHVDRLIRRFGIQQRETPPGQFHAIGGSPSRYTQGFATITLQETWKETWTKERETALPLSVRCLNRALGYTRVTHN